MTIVRIETKENSFLSITQKVCDIVENSGIQNGFCLVYCPHTTAGIIINENADPDVLHDLKLSLDTAYPRLPQFLHAEGNSAAHAKACAVGSHVMLPVREGTLFLGRWQGIFFCEFDGPRQRQYTVQILGS